MSGYTSSSTHLRRWGRSSETFPARTEPAAGTTATSTRTARLIFVALKVLLRLRRRRGCELQVGLPRSPSSLRQHLQIRPHARREQKALGRGQLCPLLRPKTLPSGHGARKERQRPVNGEEGTQGPDHAALPSCVGRAILQIVEVDVRRDVHLSGIAEHVRHQCVRPVADQRTASACAGSYSRRPGCP